MRSVTIGLAFLVILTASADEMKTAPSPLKAAFQQSREQRNIDLVLPVLKSATLYVVVGSTTQAAKTHDYFLTQSPTLGRLCVTVSETEAALAKIFWPKRKLTGERLLAELPPGIEIIVVYPDGGDYVTREQLAWYRNQR